MNTPTSDSIPQICSEAGLQCESCVAGTARELAAVCKGLRGNMIGQLFVQIYTNSACAPMHKRFAAHYLDASVPRVGPVPFPLAKPIPAIREVLVAVAAVA